MSQRNVATHRTGQYDTGCDYWSACATCPFQECVIGEWGGMDGVVRRQRPFVIYAEHELGVPVQTLALSYDLSARQVLRELSSARSSLAGS